MRRHRRNAEDVALPAPLTLRQDEIERVAGGSPTLPLPPPRFSPDPVPW